MFQTYQAWRRKLKQLYPTVTFEGDKDICQAFANGRGVGEWDGAKGEVYPQQTPALDAADQQEREWEAMRRLASK